MKLAALFGRPNVGKSTLFNRIVGGRPAIVHARPGSTRDGRLEPVEWRGVTFRLHDTGGAGAPDASPFAREIRAPRREHGGPERRRRLSWWTPAPG